MTLQTRLGRSTRPAAAATQPPSKKVLDFAQRFAIAFDSYVDWVHGLLWAASDKFGDDDATRVLCLNRCLRPLNVAHDQLEAIEAELVEGLRFEEWQPADRQRLTELQRLAAGTLTKIELFNRTKVELIGAGYIFESAPAPEGTKISRIVRDENGLISEIHSRASQ